MNSKIRWGFTECRDKINPRGLNLEYMLIVDILSIIHELIHSLFDRIIEL